MQEYGNLMNTFSDYLIYDERKGRVLHTRYLDKASFYEMWRFHFNLLRPDLSYNRNLEFNLSQKVARGLLGHLRNQSLIELRRVLLMDSASYPNDETSDILLNHMNYMSPSLAGTLYARSLSWIDASKNFNYCQEASYKAQKYGLQHCYLSVPLSEEETAKAEEELYQYFKQLLTKD
jgi:hypothetical protein